MGGKEMKPIQARLLDGARMLGALWLSGQRCTAGWTVDQACACTAPTKFCAARQQWLKMVVQDENPERRLPGSGEYGMIEIMLSSELAASRVTIKIDTGDVIGPKGQIQVKDAAAASQHPDGAAGILKLLKTFKGSRVVQSA